MTDKGCRKAEGDFDPIRDELELFRDNSHDIETKEEEIVEIIKETDVQVSKLSTQLNETNLSDELHTDGSHVPKTINNQVEKNRDTEDEEDDDEEDDTDYDMQGDECGKCLIFNFNFKKALILRNPKTKVETFLQHREGTQIDVKRLQKVFSWLRFNVVLYEDTSKQEMEEIMKREANDNANYKSKCLIVCILSHGKDGGFYTADGHLYKMDDVFEIFHADSCRSLTGKPKLFFVQACQGSKDGKVVAFDGPEPSENDENSRNQQFLAANADFFHFSSSTPGNTSWRSPKTGSWFINTLCSVLQKRANKSPFHDMVLKINNEISSCAKKLDDGTIASMMCTVRQNTLRRSLKFYPRTKKFKEYQYNPIMQASS